MLFRSGSTNVALFYINHMRIYLYDNIKLHIASSVPYIYNYTTRLQRYHPQKDLLTTIILAKYTGLQLPPDVSTSVPYIHYKATKVPSTKGSANYNNTSKIRRLATTTRS